MKKLTAKILKNLNSKNLIYAEIASPGAMGNAGGVIFYVYQNNEFETYETNCFKNEDEFMKSFLFLNRHENEFVQIDGGFGNTVYAQVSSKLKVDKKNECLIYEYDGKKLKISTSVKGVYDHIYKTITVATSLTSEDWLKYKKLNEKIIDSNYLAIKISDYTKAICYIRYRNWLGYGFSDELLQEGKWSLFKYHMRYAEEKLGRIVFTLTAGEILLQRCVKAKDAADMLVGMEEAYKVLEKKLGEDLREKFYDFKTVEWESDELDGLFRYPQLVKLSAKAEDALQQKILHEEWFSPYITGCYFRNYFEQLEVLPLDKVLPVVVHVMRRKEAISEVTMAAGDLLNQAWTFSEDDEFEKTIYEAVKPHAATWPVTYYTEFEYRNPERQKIFDDALVWLGYMRNLDKIDAELDRAMECWRVDHAPEISWWRLVTPRTEEEAKKVCTELLNEEIDNLPGAAERLLLNHSNEKVKLYILRFYLENFEKIEAMFSEIIPGMMEALYEAACEGATHESELPLLKRFAKKIQNVPTGSEAVIKRNLEIAKLQNEAMKKWKGGE